MSRVGSRGLDQIGPLRSSLYKVATWDARHKLNMNGYKVTVESLARLENWRRDHPDKHRALQLNRAIAKARFPKKKITLPKISLPD